MSSTPAQTAELLPRPYVCVVADIRIGESERVLGACSVNVARGSGEIGRLWIGWAQGVHPDVAATGRLLEMAAPGKTLEDLIGLLPSGSWALVLAANLRASLRSRMAEAGLAPPAEAPAPRYAFNLNPDHLKQLMTFAAGPEIEAGEGPQTGLVCTFARLCATAGMVGEIISSSQSLGAEGEALDRLARSAMQAGAVMARKDRDFAPEAEASQASPSAFEGARA